MKKIAAIAALILSASAYAQQSVDIKLDQVKATSPKYCRFYLTAKNNINSINISQLSLAAYYVEKDGTKIESAQLAFSRLKPGREASYEGIAKTDAGCDVVGGVQVVELRNLEIDGDSVPRNDKKYDEVYRAIKLSSAVKGVNFIKK